MDVFAYRLLLLMAVAVLLLSLLLLSFSIVLAFTKYILYKNFVLFVKGFESLNRTHIDSQI